jgi:hypothetical protein
MSVSTTEATGTLKSTDWKVEPYAELEGAFKLTCDRAVHLFHGDIEGQGTVLYLNCYSRDDAATYFGYERVVGKLAGRSGSFVLESQGAFEGAAATTDWSVAPGSGTGELRGLRGQGSWVSRLGEEEYRYRLNYYFEAGQ